MNDFDNLASNFTPLPQAQSNILERMLKAFDEAEIRSKLEQMKVSKRLKFDAFDLRK